MLKYNLIENSLDSLSEAIKYYEEGNHEDDHRAYKFCVLLLSQSIELIIKEVLYREHKVLLYDKIDSFKEDTKDYKTVSFSISLSRLKNICNVDINRIESKINQLVSIRNAVQHSSCEINHMQINKILANGFYIVNYLFVDVLKEQYDKYDEYIDKNWYLKLREIKTALVENRNIAMTKLNESDTTKYYLDFIEDDIAVQCPVCNEKFLYKTESGIKCAFCHEEFCDYQKLVDSDMYNRSYFDVMRQLDNLGIGRYDCSVCNETSLVKDMSDKHYDDGFICVCCNEGFDELTCISCSETLPDNINYYEQGRFLGGEGEEYSLCNECYEAAVDEDERQQAYMDYINS